MFDFQRLRVRGHHPAPLLAASIFLDALNVFLFFLRSSPPRNADPADHGARLDPAVRVLHSRPRLDLRPAAREVAAVFRPRPPARLAAVAALAAAALALAGCRLNLNAPDSTAPGSGGGAPARAAAQSGPLFTEPGAGFSPPTGCSATPGTTSTSPCTSSATPRPSMTWPRRPGAGCGSRSSWTGRSAAPTTPRTTTWPVPWGAGHLVLQAFEYTHQKTIVIDGKTALIMTANLTSRYYATRRDFLIQDTKQADLKAITAVFNADFAHRPSARRRPRPGLVARPTARPRCSA